MPTPPPPPDNRRTIDSRRKPVLLALVACALACAPGWAQDNDVPVPPPTRTKPPAHSSLLTRREGSSVIAAALDPDLHRAPGIDCSHLVHTIYDRAGFSYAYSPSSDLYRGADHFRRVNHPQAGDLVVWPGHVGIVVSPRRHTFFSALSHGPGTAKYNAIYWRRRGPARFFRYVKSEQSAAVLNPDR
jgi:cell wall-associated NlpC family hydrolase